MKKSRKSTKLQRKPHEQAAETPAAPDTEADRPFEHDSHNQGIQERAALARKRAATHNAQLLPETPGYVRVDGPRRQYQHEVLGDGTLRLIEV